jgi:transposase
MRAPIFVRSITDNEQGELAKGLRSSSAFTVRRSQIVLMSSQERLTAREIGERLRCSDQCVREAIRAFETEGLDSLKPKSRARHDDQQALDAAGREWLQGVVRRSPREFGFEGSLWTLDWLAELAARAGYAPKPIDRTTMSRLLKRLGLGWRRAKHWITSPDSQYEVKKSDGIG